MPKKQQVKQQTKKMTLDDLARMVKQGFDGVDKRFDLVDGRFCDIDTRFDEVNQRLDRMEKLVLPDHQRRIEHLEIDMKRMKDIFAVQ